MSQKVLDNHVIDYVPPEVILAKSSNPQLRSRTKDGLYGMAIVGALSSDPRLVSQSYMLESFSIDIITLFLFCFGF